MRNALTLASLLLAALTTGSARATEEGATTALKARDAEIRQALPEPGKEATAAHRKKIEAVITRAIDVPGMVETAMGKRWSEASPAQRKRLVKAFEDRFKQASGSELDTYRSTQVEYRPEVQGEEGSVQVPTRVEIKGEPTEITYTMKKEKERWRITDIVIDGVSTVANYRSSFARTISKEGIDGLIKRLERGAGGGSASASR